jgi:hypothetical protein
MANAERHAERDPAGHWPQEEGAVCRHVEELLSSFAATDPDDLRARPLSGYARRRASGCWGWLWWLA